LAGQTVPPRSAVSELSALLDSPEVSALIAELDGLNWTGQKGYALVLSSAPASSRRLKRGRVETILYAHSDSRQLCPCGCNRRVKPGARSDCEHFEHACRVRKLRGAPSSAAHERGVEAAADKCGFGGPR
jgi:hypothetical protein